MKRIDNRVFYRNVISIAMPIALQSLIGSSLSLIDNLMVGSLGEVELAAVGAGIQVFFLHWMLLFGFNGGAADPCAGRGIQRGQKDNIQNKEMRDTS